MKYLYYSLYMFYTRIVYVQKYYPPIVNIAAVLALLQSFLIFAFVNTYLYLSTGKEVITYSTLLPFGVALILYWLNEKYYKKKETKILAEISTKPFWMKMTIIVFSVIVIIFVSGTRTRIQRKARCKTAGRLPPRHGAPQVGGLASAQLPSCNASAAPSPT